MGASLLVLKNKSDVRGAMDEQQIRKVCFHIDDSNLLSSY